jgi:HK97 gp10 family phage protein
MAGSFKITIEGDRRLAAKFQGLSEEVRKKVIQATKKNTYLMEREAKIAAPYLTGHLKRSLRSSFHDAGMTGQVATNVEYAPYLEFGTRYMHPRPYLVPAFTIARAAYLHDLRSILRELD